MSHFSFIFLSTHHTYLLIYYCPPTSLHSVPLYLIHIFTISSFIDLFYFIINFIKSFLLPFLHYCYLSPLFLHSACFSPPLFPSFPLPSSHLLPLPPPPPGPATIKVARSTRTCRNKNQQIILIKEYGRGICILLSREKVSGIKGNLCSLTTRGRLLGGEEREWKNGGRERKGGTSGRGQRTDRQ